VDAVNSAHSAFCKPTVGLDGGNSRTGQFSFLMINQVLLLLLFESTKPADIHFAEFKLDQKALQITARSHVSDIASMSPFVWLLLSD
jgi:hypothetical protein